MNLTRINGPATSAFCIGDVAVRNRVILAPMSGVTDAPFRRLVAQLGAGLVVSEMTASDALIEGRRNAVLRAEGQGTGIHVVQLAGCEPHWMAEGARIAEGAGAEIIDINMGCPAKHVANRQSGSALMRDLDHALTLIEATVGAVSGAGHAEDAARLGRSLDQRAGACPPRGGGRRAHDHACMAAPAASSTKARPTGPRCARSRTRSRFRWSSTATSEASTTPTRRCAPPAPMPSWSAARRRGGRGCRARSRAISRPASAKQRRRSPPSLRSSPRSTTRCWRITACASASSMPASISAGRSTPRPRAPASPSTRSSAGAASVLTSETPADAHARLAQAYDAFACGAAA